MIPLSVGATDVSIDIGIVDDTGLPVTGLVASTFPTIKYSKGTGADATLSLSDLTALTDAHADGGVKERGEGVYRLDLPDAVASTLAVTTIRGEATDKRVICPRLVVGPIPNVQAGQADGLAVHGGEMAVTTAAAQKVADTTLRRTMSNVEASASGDTISNSRSLYGLVQQAKESNTVDNSGKLTIYKNDGSTELEQLTITSDANAEPTTGVS